MIRYQIVKTRLSNETRFVARVRLKESYDQAMLVKRMLEVGTSVSREDVNSVLQLLKTTVGRLCGEGCNVALDGFVRFTPSVGGTFESEAGGWASDKNVVYVNATVSSLFNTQFGLDATVEKVSATYRSPQVYSVYDLASGTNNEKVTAANIVTLEGEGLKFDLDEPGEYMRFVNAEDGSQHVDIHRFQKLSDREAVFLMPAVTFASGYFEVASSMNTARVRTERSQVLEVVA